MLARMILYSNPSSSKLIELRMIIHFIFYPKIDKNKQNDHDFQVFKGQELLVQNGHNHKDSKYILKYFTIYKLKILNYKYVLKN